MGCSSPPSTMSDNSKIFHQETITLLLDPNNQSEDLLHAQNLINLIAITRNKIIYSYHQLLYKTGACIYKSPSIVNCIKNIFFKISTELGGQFEKAGVKNIDDPPYIKIAPEGSISDFIQDLLNELFSFIIKLSYYQKFLKRIDKETAQLFYLVHEDKDNISEENIKKINQGIYLFKDLLKIRYIMLKRYREEMSEFSHRTYGYCNRINAIGRKAIEKNLTDIYEISMLEKDTNQCHPDEMYKNAEQAKLIMEKILKTEINYDESPDNGNNDVIINSGNSISIS